MNDVRRQPCNKQKFGNVLAVSPAGRRGTFPKFVFLGFWELSKLCFLGIWDFGYFGFMDFSFLGLLVVKNLAAYFWIFGFSPWDSQ